MCVDGRGSDSLGWLAARHVATERRGRSGKMQPKRRNCGGVWSQGTKAAIVGSIDPPGVINDQDQPLLLFLFLKCLDVVEKEK